jgi:hypothetical protein
MGKLLHQGKYDCKKTGASLVLVREDQSSKWCVDCGRYNGNLGSRRIFKCGNTSKRKVQRALGSLQEKLQTKVRKIERASLKHDAVCIVGSLKARKFARIATRICGGNTIGYSFNICDSF